MALNNQYFNLIRKIKHFLAESIAKTKFNQGIQVEYLASCLEGVDKSRFIENQKYLVIPITAQQGRPYQRF